MSNLPPHTPADSLQVVRLRGGLPRLQRALAGKRLVLGFMGGSITEDNGGNWPDVVAGWFMEKFPGLQIVVENAAIGATGSDSGCVRMDEEIIAHGCDLCFVEYAVNDQPRPSDLRAKSREGIIRKLLAAGIDVILVYTYNQSMHADMLAGRVPPSIADLELLAEHYGLSSVWVGLHGFNTVRAGRLKWHQWLPDGLHPSPLGSLLYGQAVIPLLEEQMGRPAASAAPSPLPDPLDRRCWQRTPAIPLADIEAQGPWLLKRVPGGRNFTQVLETHAPGACLRIPFRGRGLVLIFQYGKVSAEFRHRIDGGEWRSVARERHAWAGDRGRVDPFLAADDLPAGDHVFELEVIHGDRPDCGGTECRLAQVNIIA